MPLFLIPVRGMSIEFPPSLFYLAFNLSIQAIQSLADIGYPGQNAAEHSTASIPVGMHKGQTGHDIVQATSCIRARGNLYCKDLFFM